MTTSSISVQNDLDSIVTAYLEDPTPKLLSVVLKKTKYICKAWMSKSSKAPDFEDQADDLALEFVCMLVERRMDDTPYKTLTTMLLRPQAKSFQNMLVQLSTNQ